MAFFGVNLILQKFCQCKKNDKYQVWLYCWKNRAMSQRISFSKIMRCWVPWHFLSWYFYAFCLRICNLLQNFRLNKYEFSFHLNEHVLNLWYFWSKWKIRVAAAKLKRKSRPNPSQASVWWKIVDRKKKCTLLGESLNVGY